MLSRARSPRYAQASEDDVKRVLNGMTYNTDTSERIARSDGNMAM